jgi:hypothetical protein
MRDLSWLRKEEYILIIHDFHDFLKNDLHLREIIVEDINDTILPFWEHEVEHCVVEGKAKPFNVYFVD